MYGPQFIHLILLHMNIYGNLLHMNVIKHILAEIYNSIGIYNRMYNRVGNKQCIVLHLYL